MNKYAIVVIICLSFLAGCTNFEKTIEKIATSPRSSESNQPRDKDQIKKSVVKITSQGRQGTGFIVGLMSDTVYILTISHVVTGDSEPKVEFFGQARKFKAETLAIEGQQANGFALLAVTGSIPSDAIPLYVNYKFEFKEGDSVFTFGFPTSGGNWAYDELSYSSRIAREIIFSGNVKKGNSGSPLIKGDEVVGMVTSMTTGSAHANSSTSIIEFLRGVKEGSIVLEQMEKWGVNWREAYDKHRIAAEKAAAAKDDELARLREENERLRKAGILQPEVTSSQPSKSFRDKLKDGSLGPEMVQIPAGTFRMGSNDGESDEKPVHTVSVKSFAMGKYEVTRGEFRKFVEATSYKTEAEKERGCYGWTGSEWKENSAYNWKNIGFIQDDKHPVVCVNQNDAKAYVKWLSEQTGKDYRLPSEAQWEYAVRAGSTSKYFWGENVNEACRYANVADKKAKEQFSNWSIVDCADGYVFTSPVGVFESNKFGLYDMTGNVWEWLEDVWHDNYNGAPSDGSAWVNGDNRYQWHLLRGGSWDVDDNLLRCANRDGFGSTFGSYFKGLRISRM